MAETASTKSKTGKIAEQSDKRPCEPLRQPVLSGAPAQLLTLQQTIGNQGVSRLLQSGTSVMPAIQTKLTISQPGDKHEQEADRIAEMVTRPDGQMPPGLSTGPQQIQRKCEACNSGQGPCPKCAEEEIQLKPLTSIITPLVQRQSGEEEKEEGAASPEIKEDPGRTPPVATDAQQARIRSLRSGGQPLPNGPRAFFESRFNYDFSGVRVHTGSRAAEAARTMKARAFTIGRDVVFGSGQYAPESNEGRQLLAHELTHVVQQTSPASPMTPTVQRQASSTVAAADKDSDREEGIKTPELIAEDTATQLGPGQMKKSEFLAELRAEVCRTAEEALAGTGQTTENCPYLTFWFDHYSQKDGQHIERAIYKYAPETAGVTTAREYIPPITARVRRGVEVWARTGEITGAPEGVSAESPGANGAGNGNASASPTGNILFKGRDGGVSEGGNPRAVQAQLGDGRPLDGGVRSRMESAFGTNFSHVRVHTDANAVALSNRFNARAFTVGEHVAFGSGEYRPGTLIGDAIMAHELAHVAQQEDLSPDISPKTDKGLAYNSLEEDADLSAVGAVISLWGNAKGRLKELALKAKPRLKSGLRLQGCSSRDCPSGYFWEAQSAIGAGIGPATCKWRCVKSSSPGVRGRNQIRPLNLPEQQTGGTVTNQGDCICFAPEDEDGNKYTADQKVDCAVAQGGGRRGGRGGRGGRAGVQGSGGGGGGNKPPTTPPVTKPPVTKPSVTKPPAPEKTAQQIEGEKLDALRAQRSSKQGELEKLQQRTRELEKQINQAENDRKTASREHDKATTREAKDQAVAKMRDAKARRDTSKEELDKLPSDDSLKREIKKLDSQIEAKTPKPPTQAQGRDPLDVEVEKNNPKPPPAKATGKIGESAAQDAELQKDIANAKTLGATDIRVNQEQVNAKGVRVGINKPDLQYTLPDGTRVYIEYDTTKSGRGPGHKERILANDPNGKVDLKIID